MSKFQFHDMKVSIRNQIVHESIFILGPIWTQNLHNYNYQFTSMKLGKNKHSCTTCLETSMKRKHFLRCQRRKGLLKK